MLLATGVTGWFTHCVVKGVEEMLLSACLLLYVHVSVNFDL